MLSKLALEEVTKVIQETEITVEHVDDWTIPRIHTLAIAIKQLQVEMVGLQQRLETLGGPF